MEKAKERGQAKECRRKNSGGQITADSFDQFALLRAGLYPHIEDR